MMTYFTAFIFYTMAMVGVLLLGFVIYKKTYTNSQNKNKGTIKVIDSLPIGPKKTLLVVKIKNEKFLIASGAEHTTFLSKLENNEEIVQEEKTPSFNEAFQQKEEILNHLIPQMKLKREEMSSEELHQARLAKMQQQFQELYSQNSTDSQKEKLSPADKLKMMSDVRNKSLNRREMIKSLLKDLNETEHTKIGSNF